MIAPVFRKELIDHLRDRRSIFSGLLMPLLGPLMMLGVFALLASWMREDRPLKVPVAGAKNAPTLIAFLQRNGAEVSDAPADYEAQVRDGKLDFAISVPEEYGKEFEAGRSAPLQIVDDSSQNKARPQVLRARRLLELYVRRVSALRMIARGVSPALVAPLELTEVDLATPEKTAANVLGMLPVYLLMAVFVGGLYLAIDCAAGERERQSLEALLVNPVSRSHIVAGKWLAVAVATLAAVLVSLVGFTAALEFVPLQNLGVRFHFTGPVLLGLLAACVPMALFAAALQMTLAFFARSFKEATTYLSLLMMVPLLPAVFFAVQPVKSALWMMLIPVVGQTLLMGDAMRGEPSPAGWYALAAITSLASAALLLAWAARLLRSEKIVFGR
ncbi:MAG TPA: ABC transporter permease subunit [Myxococcales bacterium]|nr:ABC transporter permease subunit [Myxococcales bacterium]